MHKDENQYAGFWVRALACIIDNLLLGVISSAMSYLFFSVLNILKISDYTFEMYFSLDPIPPVIEYALSIITMIAMVAIITSFLIGKWHATPAKRLLGIYVVDTDFKPLALKQAIFRTALPYSLTILMLLINSTTKNNSTDVSKQDSLKPTISEEILVADDKILRDLLPLTAKKMTESGDGDYFLVDNILNESKLKDVFESEKNTLTTENKKQVDDLYNKFTKNGENMMEKNNNTPEFPSFLMFVYIFWFFLVFIWYAIAGFTKQKTAIHDIIAKTRVIKGRL